MGKEILTSILSAGLGMLLTYIFTELRTRKKRQNALQTGLQALLRDRIIQSYNHYVTEKNGFLFMLKIVWFPAMKVMKTLALME